MARRFTAVLARLGTPTGDGRILSPGGISSRDLPLPLSWQRQSGEGHGGSEVIGRFETIDIGQDMVTATGSLLDSADWSDAVEQIEAGVIGPSVDLDDLTYVVGDDDSVVITSARIAGATLVAIPAFADVSITLAPLPVDPVPVGVPDDMDSEAMYESLYASGGVSRETSLPPLEWFTNPMFSGPTPLTVTDEGRVFGHIAPWDQCHVGLPGCTTAPSSRTDYAHFLRKEQATVDGTVVPAGVLTVGSGHAHTDGSVQMAMEHYDDPRCATAKVFAGEDEHGIWVAGWILPYADPVKVAQLSDLDVSGDWRRIGGSMELIGVCAVNVPGFEVLKKVHFSLGQGGQQTLIGQFKVTRTGDVSRETLADDDSADAARAAWAKLKWRGQV